MSLQAITIPPATGGAPTGLIALLHGWGANAEDVAGLVPYLHLPDYAIAMPNAPFPHPYTAIGRMWYDIPTAYSFQNNAPEQPGEELAASRALLQTWLPATAAKLGVPLSRTFLAGFSQGGAMTLDVGLHLPLAGLMVLSGYLHHDIPKALTAPPVLMVHGRMDQVVPLRAAQGARDRLMTSGINVQYYELDMGHEVQISVLDLLRSFVQAVKLGQ
ncbi:serine esterase [Leptolyngbya sp. 'hensonii']|uniref:alpha/beta hydrolase n=1 Tax=Leptolyngbya sp. 'hensonii' TaxID=1922337 RepID=UPI00094F5673|nr:serine esterase [Leptolyngbya sp. 'hensonii']OLP18152.1 serine esterase [Leptolyngbya sp. 'hensonii']